MEFGVFSLACGYNGGNFDECGLKVSPGHSKFVFTRILYVSKGSFERVGLCSLSDRGILYCCCSCQRGCFRSLYFGPQIRAVGCVDWLYIHDFVMAPAFLVFFMLPLS